MRIGHFALLSLFLLFLFSKDCGCLQAILINNNIQTTKDLANIMPVPQSPWVSWSSQETETLDGTPH